MGESGMQRIGKLMQNKKRRDESRGVFCVIRLIAFD